MKTYLNQLRSNIKQKPQEVFVGICVFFVAIMATSVSHVVSTVFGLLLIASFLIIKDWSTLWQELEKHEKWLLAGFSLYAISGLISFINVQDVDEYIKDAERYIRFLLAIPIYLFFKKYNINVTQYLYAGAIFSGPFLFTIAFSDFVNNPNEPAKGDYHHILFGAVAMLNVGVMLAILLTAKTNYIAKTFVVIAMILAFMAAIFSQSRGVWMALPVYILMALYYSIKHSKISITSIAIGLSLLLCLIIFSPIGKMVDKRIDAAVNEVSTFYSSNNYTSSLGARLAMWGIATDVWQKNPLVGTGLGDFDEEIRSLQKNGEYVGMLAFASTHNIYVQALVSTGLIGFIVALVVLFLVPLKLFLMNREKYLVASISGIFTIAFFAIIGLSMSWTLRLPMLTVFILYVLSLISSMNVAKVNSGCK